MDGGHVYPEYDTLAAAYAESGDFDDAISNEDIALTALQADPKLVADFGKRMDLYKAHQPYHAARP
jgi:hypothetical protein